MSYKISSFKAYFNVVVAKMPDIRSAKARPGHEEHLENAALRSRVKKSYEKAQQEEAFKELLKLIGANGGKLPCGSMDKLIKNIKTMVLKP